MPAASEATTKQAKTSVGVISSRIRKITTAAAHIQNMVDMPFLSPCRYLARSPASLRPSAGPAEIAGIMPYDGNVEAAKST
jgi:hypothetical protein